VPVTIALGLLLIPRLGIEGAAIASIAAYGASAAVVLVLFVRVTGRPVWETLVINRLDISSSVDSAKTLLARSEASG
jgi:Na+-driven multidrug efflux pump